MTNASLHEMVSSSGLSNDQTGQVLRVLEEYLADLERGGRPQPDELIARHPDFADLLKKYLDQLDLLHQAAVGFHVAEPHAATDTPPETDLGLLGDFRLLRELGRGGMGVVYEAEQISLGRRVALKVLPFASTMDARQLQRFQNEARAAASLHHTNIVPVHYVGCERGVHFYAMQYIEGRDLASILTQMRQSAAPKVPESKDVETVDASNGHALSSASLPGEDTRPIAGLSIAGSTRSREYFQTVAKLGIQAAEALDCAHQQGIVHRDVKPGNLLVDTTGRLWVTDFGLAQMQTDTRLTMTGDLIGTLRYMSPEQALAKRVVIDHRTDIYSLGATLYELLTLEPAFDGGDRQELLRQIAFEEPRQPRRINRAIPQELETIVLKAMDRNPVDRYATAQELADDLRNYLEDRPIRAKRPSLPQRFAKWRRRHKALVLGSVAVVSTVLVLGGTTFWREHLEQQNQRSALAQAVGEDLREADLLQLQERWPEALQVLERASGRLGAERSDALREQIEQRRRNAGLVAKLEEASLEAATVGADGFDFKQAVQAYAATYLSQEIDLEELSPEEAAERLRASAIRKQLVPALDHWAFCCKRAKNTAMEARILSVARMADDDAWRQQLRDPKVCTDLAALEDLAQAEDVLTQPPANLFLLSKALTDLNGRAAAVRLLRRAQQRHPSDFWINYELANCLYQDAAKTEAIGFYRVALALRSHSPAVYNNLGTALWAQEKLLEAEIVFREVIAIQPDYALSYRNLSVVLLNQKRFAEAEAASRKVIALQPEDAKGYSTLGMSLHSQKKLAEAETALNKAIALDPGDAAGYHELALVLRDRNKLAEARAAIAKAQSLFQPDDAKHCNALGVTLGLQGQLPQAEAAFRKAIAMQPDFADAYNNLGRTLALQRKFPEAEVACRKAIELKHDFADPYFHLGLTYQNWGKPAKAVDAYRMAVALNFRECSDIGVNLIGLNKLPDAEVAFRKAIELNPNLAVAYSNLGSVLNSRKQLSEAESAYRKAIELKDDYAEAHCNLGYTLRAQGRFSESLVELKRGHELGNQKVAPWVREVERLIELDAYLPKIVSGQAQPANTAELLELANFCQLHKNYFTAAVRFFEKAFATKSTLAEDLNAANRYNAACAAALAASGEGKDAAVLDENERARLRQLSLNWLKADLALWIRQTEQNGDKIYGILDKTMTHWLADTDFKGVRGADAIANLPETERTEWQRLWGDVDTLRQRAHSKAEEVAKRLVEIEAKLLQVLNGEAKSANAGESLELAFLCQKKQSYVTAVRFFEEALAGQPASTDDATIRRNRQSAARCAALAGCGKGKDAAALDEKDRTRLRRQSLDWVRINLAVWVRLMDEKPAKVRGNCENTMAAWLANPEFNSVRGPEALAKLPEAERAEWQKLWEEVAALRQRTRGKVK